MIADVPREAGPCARLGEDSTGRTLKEARVDAEVPQSNLDLPVGEALSVCPQLEVHADGGWCWIAKGVELIPGAVVADELDHPVAAPDYSERSPSVVR